MVKTALCCIIKEENLYLKEYIDYYLQLGIDKIFIYDNNSPLGEHPEDVTDVFGDKIEIINYRGKTNAQTQAYNDCYQKHNQEFDWICFFDIDEYLTLVKHSTINDYLSEPMFEKADMIHINWMLYDDNDLLRYDSRPMIERFTRPCDSEKTIIEGQSLSVNRHIKTIIKGQRNIQWQPYHNPHSPSIIPKNTICLDNKGNICNAYNYWTDYNFEYAYLKHFTTKTIEEYANKRKRGFPDQSKTESDKAISLKHFYIFNKNQKKKKKFGKN